MCLYCVFFSNRSRAHHPNHKFQRPRRKAGHWKPVGCKDVKIYICYIRYNTLCVVVVMYIFQCKIKVEGKTISAQKENSLTAVSFLSTSSGTTSSRVLPPTLSSTSFKMSMTAALNFFLMASVFPTCFLWAKKVNMEAYRPTTRTYIGFNPSCSTSTIEVKSVNSLMVLMT